VLTWFVAEHMFSCRVNRPHPQDPGDRVWEGPRGRHVHCALDVDHVRRVPRETAAPSVGGGRTGTREAAGPTNGAGNASVPGGLRSGAWMLALWAVRGPLPREGAEGQSGA
jgi:hypothetical protein